MGLIDGTYLDHYHNYRQNKMINIISRDNIIRRESYCFHLLGVHLEGSTSPRYLGWNWDGGRMGQNVLLAAQEGDYRGQVVVVDVSFSSESSWVPSSYHFARTILLWRMDLSQTFRSWMDLVVYSSCCVVDPRTFLEVFADWAVIVIILVLFSPPSVWQELLVDNFWFLGFQTATYVYQI